MRGKKLIATLAVSAVLFAGCGLKSGEAVIKVNSTKITQAQFDTAFNRQLKSGALAQMNPEAQKDKSGFMYNLIKERVVNELIIKALINQEIAKRNIKVSGKEFDAALKEIVDKVGSKEQLNEILKKNNISPAQFRKDLTDEVATKKLIAELGSGNVSDADVKKFYKDNLDKFNVPDKVRASHILISVNPEEIKEIIAAEPDNKGLSKEQVQTKVDKEVAARKTKAQNLLAEIKKDKSQFAKLAKENSEDPVSAKKGGDLGFFTAKEMVPEFSKAAFALKPNTVSKELVQSQYGYHIILVTDRAAAGQEPLDKVKNDIKAYLEQQKQLDMLDKLIESLKKNAQIEYLNPEFDPATLQAELQKQIQGAEKANEQKEAAKKN
jgi:parvulin-like peptidyl-prolyl isomerase